MWHCSLVENSCILVSILQLHEIKNKLNGDQKNWSKPGIHPFTLWIPWLIQTEAYQRWLLTRLDDSHPTAAHPHYPSVPKDQRKLRVSIIVSLGTQLCWSHEHLMGTLAKGNTSLHDHLHIITHLRRPHRTELGSMGHLHTQCVSEDPDVCVCVCVGACLRICSGLIVHLTHALWWCSEITIKMTHVPSLSWHHIPALFPSFCRFPAAHTHKHPHPSSPLSLSHLLSQVETLRSHV